MVRLDTDLIILNPGGVQIPVYIEGEAPPEPDLPEEYYTVSEDYSGNAVSADNEAQELLYEFTLKWYTKDPERLYTGLTDAIAYLKAKGYDAEGVGYGNGKYYGWFSRAVDIDKYEFLEG